MAVLGLVEAGLLALTVLFQVTSMDGAFDVVARPSGVLAGPAVVLGLGLAVRPARVTP